MRPHASLAAAPIVNTSEAVKTNGSDLTPGDGNALEKNADQMNPATPPVGSGSTLAAGAKMLRSCASVSKNSITFLP